MPAALPPAQSIFPRLRAQFEPFESARFVDRFSAILATIHEFQGLFWPIWGPIAQKIARRRVISGGYSLSLLTRVLTRLNGPPDNTRF